MYVLVPCTSRHPTWALSIALTSPYHLEHTTTTPSMVGIRKGAIISKATASVTLAWCRICATILHRHAPHSKAPGALQVPDHSLCQLTPKARCIQEFFLLPIYASMALHKQSHKGWLFNSDTMEPLVSLGEGVLAVHGKKKTKTKGMV